MASTEPVVLEEVEGGLNPGTLNKDYIFKLRSKRQQEYAHQRNRRTDFKVLSDDFEQWLKDNPNQGEEKGPQRAMINEKGNVIPLDAKGNFIQQIN